MSEGAWNFLGMLVTALASGIGTFFGFLTGMKMIKYRVDKIEQSESALTEKQKATDNEVSEVKITITAIQEHDKRQDARLDKVEKKQDELIKFHMKG